MLYVLADYLGLGETERRIKLVKQLKGKEMSWTLGRSLHTQPFPSTCPLCVCVSFGRPFRSSFG